MFGAKKMLAAFRRCTAFFLIILTSLGYISPVFDFVYPPEAEAAQVTIDSSAATTGTSHLQSGGQTVFIDDQTGYKFYRDFNGQCVYSKTTNGGAAWGSAVTVDAQGGGADCVQIQVWYDKWTPGSASSSIHIATLDTSADDIWYNRLDPSNDTLLMGSGPVSMVTNPAQGGTIVEGQNTISITRGTDGTIYAVSNDATDAYIVECTVSCNLATSWTETGITTPLDLANDYDILVPLASGNIMVIDRDISLEDIRYKIWNNTAWSASWSFIDQNATDNITYDVGMAASVSSTTPGNVYLVYAADNATLGTDDTVRTAFYNGTTWATTTNVISGGATRAITGVAIGIDAANNDVYAAYSARTTAGTPGTGNIYWKKSTDKMVSWSPEVGPINSAANDMYGVDLSMLNDQRIYATWFGVTGATIFGNTIADIFPGIHASTTGSQIASVLAGTSNVYIGGAFVFTENYKSQNITDITISASGTIDAANNIANVKLFYEMDTVAPFDCASVVYNGNESQFGSTDTNGFSGANGVSSFTGTTVTVSTSTALCVYPVMDILDSTQSSSTLDIYIANPATDVIVTDAIAGPPTEQAISGKTIIYNDTATQIHYHWRNDDGTEITATSRTGGVEDTALASFKQGSTTRLRIEVTNAGSSSTPAMQYRLEYAMATGVCSAATGWSDVGLAGGDFDMYNSPNLTDGNNTTDIAVASGGVTNANTTFLTPNGGVRDTTSQTAPLTLTTSQFAEFEYSISASLTAVQGNTYCFRVSDAGNSLASYAVYPRVTINSDVTVGIATSTQKATTTIPSANFYVGSAFTVTENSGSRTVTSVMLTETGTVDAQSGLANIKLFYDQDTTAPYDCGDQVYTGVEPQFGATDIDGFSGPNGTSTFTGSVTIATTSTLCLYTMVDVVSDAQNNQTVNIVIQQPVTDVTVSGGGSVSPTSVLDMNGSTLLYGPDLKQIHYHWRNDNGTEVTATSLTGGLEDTPISNIPETTPVRLRIEVTNAATTTSLSRPLRLEYGTKITSCSAVSTWTDVGAAGGAWDMFNSVNLTDGTDTTNIVVASGGVTDANTTFLTPNSAVKDTSSSIASSSLTSTQFIEGEFAIKQTADAGYEVPYCFRLTANGTALNTYTVYPELTTSPKRDFEIQRGTVTITSTSTVITAGVDYTAPSSTASAFIRITNTSMTGAGRNAGNATAQNASNVTAYIVNPGNLMTSVMFARTGVTDNTRVSWEIVEYIGPPGGDNEIIVRSQSFVTYGTAATAATGTAVTGVVNNADVVVFITGQQNPLANATAYNTGLSTSAWSSVAQAPVFTRGSASANAVNTSYAVVEFTGLNWTIQRSEHTYTTAGTTETEPITAVNSLSKTFIHVQKRNAAALNGQDEFGHEVWLSSIGFVSYFLESGATTPSGQTSVVWIIENTQNTSGAMDVTRSNGNTNAGTAPLIISVPTGKTLTDLTNASIFTNARGSGTGTVYPVPIAGVTIASSTAYELWRSNTGGTLTYRTEIVEWPTAGLSIKQNYYRFYTDNNALKPADPWPVGAVDLGENTIITASDEPLGEGEHIRLRMSLKATNATFPANTKAFRLQYGQLVTSCAAISEANWITLGNAASSTIWRGYNATGTTDGTQISGNPPTAGDLLLSVSDVAGTLEEENDTTINAYSVPSGSDLEFDWNIQQNGATAETYYCFRMVEADNTTLDTYLQYPQLRTASFTPRTQQWRWFDDEQNATPTTSLAWYDTAPVDVADTQIVALRVTVKEIKNIARNDVRFKLQYSKFSNFSSVSDVVATTTCVATSTWCYADGAGVDNAKISSTTLQDTSGCTAGVGNGCGTYNESPSLLTGFRHEASAAAEYSFTLKSAHPEMNRVYYFRLYDLIQDAPVIPNTGNQYPSLVTEGAKLTFTMGGLASSTVTEGVTTDVTTTNAQVPYGRLSIGADIEAAQRLTVTTNAAQGYQIFMMLNGDLLSSSGDAIKPITSTNVSPIAWNTACSGSETSCFGYHSGDHTLSGGSTRFFASDTYARFSTTTLDEVVYAGVPVTNDTIDMIYRVRIMQLQEAGQYTANIRYITVPVF